MNKRPEHDCEQNRVNYGVHKPVVKFDETTGCVENEDYSRSN
jgi:hypothetical protein